MEFNVYKDMEKRTKGELYLGVVGPVRTGKSTFIKRFMDLVVIPNIKDENDVVRTLDELPQSSSGKTIMTTEPKFIPNNSVNIMIGDNSNVSVRLIDCVGFMVDGANGYQEEDKERMIKTPWFEEDIPFSKAAEIGTKKVINDHSSIGIVVTTDGSFTDIDVDAYNVALDKTIMELNATNKPYVILLNSIEPESERCKELKNEIESKYKVTTIAVNCLKLTVEDVEKIMKCILFEFPIGQLVFDIPDWIQVFDDDSQILKEIVDYSKEILNKVFKIKDIFNVDISKENKMVSGVKINDIKLCNGDINIHYQIDEKVYYDLISEMSGLDITNQLDLIRFLKDVSMQRINYEKVNDAILKVKDSGYGIVTPEQSEIKLEDPQIFKSGNRYGVKLKAYAPSIHFIKTDVLTEISPVVGTKEQADDLIEFINQQDKQSNIWDTNILGKSIGQIVEDGINTKINNLNEETQAKMQGTIEKITNDQSRGVICIVL